MNIIESYYPQLQRDTPGKGERKKQDILNTATQLFFTKGYLATTVQDILEQLNCSKGSFYYHFESKLDVLTGIAHQRAFVSHTAYSGIKPMEPVAAMNLLLHYASPLRLKEIGLIRSLAALAHIQEGAILQDALNEAAFLSFYSDFERMAFELKQAEMAAFGNDDELKLTFHSFLGGCTLIIREAAGMGVPDAKNRVLPLMKALRRQTEASLGMLAGSLPITQSAELLEILGYLRQ